jgi:antigen flippase
MKPLMNAAAFTGLATVVSLLVGIGRTKLVAVMIGAAGVGLISQVGVALSFTTEFASIGFANAVTRGTAVAETDKQAHHASSLLATAYVVSLAIALPFVLILLVAPQQVANTIFGGEGPPLGLVALAIAVPFTALTGMERAVLQGLRSVRHLAVSGSVSAILGLILLVPLVFGFGLPGAFVHIAVFAIATYVLSYWARVLAAGHRGFAVSPLSRPSLGALRILLSYGSANAIAGIANTATLLIIRTYIINSLGAEQNGVYQVVWSIPSQILSIIFGALSSYAFPLISGLREQHRISEEINVALRFSMLLAAPIVCIMVVMSGPLVSLFYSRQFLAAVPLLPLQLVGNFFKIVAWAVGLSLLGRKHLVAFTSFDLIWNAIFAVGVFLLLGRVGLFGAVVSYAIGYIIHAIIVYLYQRDREGFRLTAANVRLLACSCVLVGGAAVCAASGRIEYQSLYTVIALLLWAALGTLHHERTQAWTTAKLWLRSKPFSARPA